MARAEDVRGRVSIENLDPRFKLNFRDEDSSRAILENALVFTGDDVNEARRLLLKVVFRLYGTTLGESLFVRDRGDSMPSENEVTMNMARILSIPEELWSEEVANRTARTIMIYPYELDTLVNMMKSLGGDRAIRYFKREIVSRNGMPFPEGIEDQAATSYPKMAGLSFWEMEKDVVIMNLLKCHVAWKRGLEGFDQVPEFLQESVELVLSEARSRLRRLANVMLGRKLIRSGSSIELKHFKEIISYDDICHLLD